MRKLKSEFKFDKSLTDKMKDFYTRTTNNKNYKFFGVYRYKDYLIQHDNVPEGHQIFNHISISRYKFERCDEEDINYIAKYFIGKKYKIVNPILSNKIINVYSEISTVNC